MSATRRTKAAKAESTDLYPTPPALALAAVRALVSDGWISPTHEPLILEPSVGTGAWARALLSEGFAPDTIDVGDIDRELVDRSPTTGNRFVGDFLSLQVQKRYDVIVGNPPYNDATRHVAKSLGLLAHGGVCALLLRDGWMAAALSREIDESRPERHRRTWLWGADGNSGAAKPRHIYLVMPRPSFRSKGGGSDASTYVIPVWGATPSTALPTFSGLIWK